MVTTPEKQDENIRRDERAETVKTKNRMLKALAQTKGNVSVACERVGITRRTHYNYLDSDPDYAARCDEVKEKLLDDVESLFLKSTFEADDRRSMRWFLERQGRKRGYGRVDAHELSGPDGEPIQTEGTLAVKTLREQLPDSSVREALIDLVASQPQLLKRGVLPSNRLGNSN